MKRKILYKILFVLLSTIILPRMQAQVTIGAGDTPIYGALLQLKENEGQNVNSERGLGMPRVTLTDLNSLIDINGNPEPISHTGLTVYDVNTSEGSIPNPIFPGLYSWNGNNWESLFSIDKTPVPGVGSVTDQNGHVYPTMHYTADDSGTTIDAGIWMTENIRATSYDTDIINPPTLGRSNTHAPGNPTYYYPNSEVDNITGDLAHDSLFFKRHPEFGLMYNWEAATANKNQVGQVDQGQGSGNELATPIQGICPNGWHLPSDREWNELEKVIALNSSKYSTYSPGSTTWDSSWESTIKTFRPATGNGHGLAMQMPCKLVDSQYSNPNGKSLPTYKGGFSVLFVGFISNNDGLASGYGGLGIYWASSNYDNGNAWFRELLIDRNGVDRAFIGKEFLGSVRCKKD